MTMSKLVASAVLAAALAAPGLAQSASELLQKGIYTQETAGDLDGAIQIYRQIVGSAPAQHEIAAEAQYRLAQALVRKGDLTGAALEFQKLARDYSEYQALISRMSATPQPQALHIAPAPLSAEFDSSRPVTVSGAVTQIQWMNPRSWLSVKDGTGIEWRIALASPQALTAQQWTKDAVKLGDQVVVNGSLAKDGAKIAAAVTVYASDGRKLFDSASVAEATGAEQDRLKAQAMNPAPIRRVPDSGFLRASFASSEDYDPNAPISVTGVIVETRMLNPTASIVMDSTEGPAGRYIFALAPPQNLIRLGGFANGNIPKAGDKIAVKGFLAVNPRTNDGRVQAMAVTIVGIDGNRVFRVFDRTSFQPAPPSN